MKSRMRSDEKNRGHSSSTVEVAARRSNGQIDLALDVTQLPAPDDTLYVDTMSVVAPPYARIIRGEIVDHAGGSEASVVQVVFDIQSFEQFKKTLEPLHSRVSQAAPTPPPTSGRVHLLGTYRASVCYAVVGDLGATLDFFSIDQNDVHLVERGKRRTLRLTNVLRLSTFPGALKAIVEGGH